MKTLIFATVLAALALPAAAQTGASHDGSNIVRVKVRFSDLDLSRQAGANIMISRIRNAARIVCGAEPDLRELEAGKRYDFCIASATKAAVTQLDAPLVTATYFRTYPARLLAKR